VTLLQTLVLQQKQRRQQQKQQQQQQQQQQQEQQQNATASAAPQEQQQDLSTAISRKAEEILQMQSSLPLSISSTLTTTTSTLPPPPGTASAPAISTGATAPVVTVAQPDIPEGDIQAAILSNLFTSHTSISDDPAHSSSSLLFHTSSDTVDQLLRGLNTRSQSEAIQKLSQETACVLPNFARALQSSIGLPPSLPPHSPTLPLSPAPLSYPSSSGRETGDGGVVETRELFLSGDDDESSGGGHSGLALSDVLVGGAGEDTTFQQLARTTGLLDGLDLPMDTLSQLPATPPRTARGTTTTSGLLSPPSNVSLTCLSVSLYALTLYIHTIV
jgi:type II secretory pathway pseudopilin PulG